MNNDCQKAGDMLVEYINRHLSESENFAVISHLAVCRQCREETALLLKIKRSAEAEMIEVPVALIDAVFEKIPDRDPLEEIINRKSVFMGLDIMRYVLKESGRTVRYALQYTSQ